MPPFKRIYLEELARIQDRVNSLFEQALLPAEYDEADGGLPGMWAPAVDVVETEDAYLVYAELPGVRREDIQLHAHERRLELSGGRHALGENRNFLRMERNYGPFRRVIDLEASIDPDAVDATFELGILRIRLAKRGRAVSIPVTE
jgi:HSP20 family protein